MNTGRRPFTLDIYTWDGRRGVDPEVRTTHHYTPDAARTLVNEQIIPFRYAVLQKHDDEGNAYACDWEGRTLTESDPWPMIRGRNGIHPAVQRLSDDWFTMIRIIRAEHATNGGGTISIAGHLLSTRHPATSGWATTLGWEAAAKPGTECAPF